MNEKRERMVNRKIAFAALFVIQAAVSLNASIVTVTSLANAGPGTLRSQIAASAAGDTVQFTVNGTILLSSSITIDHDLTVQGPGASFLTVNASHLDRAFITTGNTVFLSGMTVTNGFVAGPNGLDAAGPGLNGGPGVDAFGGAILDYSVSLELSNCWFTGNSVQGGRGGFGGPNPIGAAFVPGKGGAGGAGNGGAILATGAVFVVNCTFSGNRALAGNGGVGGTNFNAAVHESGGTGGMGGFSSGGAMDLINSTAVDQRLFVNCTFSSNNVVGGRGGLGGDSLNGQGGQGGNGNSAGGGGIDSFAMDLFSCTIVSNSVYGGTGGLGGNGAPPGINGTAGGGTGGGVVGYSIGCLSQIENTIIAENFASDSSSNFFIGFVDQGYNFLGTSDPLFCSLNKPTTRVGTSLVPLHPQLEPLAQNGGGTPTHATTTTSPVTDAGIAVPFPFDERGAPRPYDFSSIPNVDDGSDIGAFELGSADLGLGTSSNNVVISWPAYYGDFMLQTATNLQGSNSWSVVPDMPVVTGNQFVVTNRITNGIKFYRLSGH